MDEDSGREDAGQNDAGQEDAGQDAAPQPSGISRRGLVVGGGVAAAATLVGGFFAGRAVPYDDASDGGHAGGTGSGDHRIHYRSTDLTAPKMTVHRSGTTAPGLLFLQPLNTDYNGIIVNNDGEPVWIEPSLKALTDLQVQQFEGKDVLTYWSGAMYKHHGRGSCTILDSSYQPIAQVHAAGGIKADLHEFNLTERGTALITAYGTAQADLRPVGGPEHGWVFEGHVQEIDVRSGAVLLDWASLDHVPVEDTYQGLGDVSGQNGGTPSGAFDYFHVNAIAEDGDTLLVSARHTHTIYRIDRTSGTVIWRFGGRHSDIAVDEDARFAWQHHVRRHDDGSISLFDNHLKTEAPDVYSRGMVFRVDEKARTASLLNTYSNRHLGTAMGSTQLLSDGHVLIGWGVAPYATEFAADGTVIYEANIGGKSYRAFRFPWHATPASHPAVAVSDADGGMHVHVSWNGATDVAHWRILTGAGASSLTKAATVARRGFETTVQVPRAAAVRAEALDGSGTVLGRSRVVKS